MLLSRRFLSGNSVGFHRKREHAVAFMSMLRRKGVREVSITEHADDTPPQADGGHHRVRDEFYSENLPKRSSGECGRPPPGATGWAAGPPTAITGSWCRTVPRSAPPWNWTRRGPGGQAHLRPGRGRHRDAEDHPDPQRRGYRQPHRQALVQERVHFILRNEVYTGTLVWGTKGKDKADRCASKRRFLPSSPRPSSAASTS